VTEEYRRAGDEWARMEEAGELPADDDEREELLRSTEKKCAELHALVMKLKHEATAAKAEAAEVGAGKWDGRPPPGTRAARLNTSWELLQGSFWIHEPCSKAAAGVQREVTARATAAAAAAEAGRRGRGLTAGSRPRRTTTASPRSTAC
jgi:hypothetical protein